jgi:hypothetical protein
MRLLKLLSVSAIFCAAFFGCTRQQEFLAVNALVRVPFVDRTEKEINDWFDNRTIIDDQKIISAAVNGEPKVLLIVDGPKLVVNGTNYPATICITQTNTFPGNQPAKYTALVGIKVLRDHADLFECGEIDVSEQSCDGNTMAVNVVTFHSKSELKNAFRNAVDEWLDGDIVKTLKSSTNKEGFADPATTLTRDPAKSHGALYNATEDKGPPVVRTIGFLAV